MRERQAERGTATPSRSTRKRPSASMATAAEGSGIAGGHLRARAELAQARLGLAGGGRPRSPGQRQGERELRACLAEGIAELVPDRDGLLERCVARALGRARQALELERLGHAGPIAAPARRRPGLRGRPRGSVAVGGGQRDVADGEQGGRLAHAGPVARGAMGDGGRLLGVVAREHAREAGQRGHERLQVAHGVAAPRRLLVGSARERHVAALAVDVAEDAQRVGDVVGAQPLVDQARGVEVGDRLLQTAQAQARLAAVGQRQGAEGAEPAEVGQADGEIQLDDRGLVGALLQVARAAVDTDADDLQDIAGALGVVEGAQVMGVVAGAVALERGEHGQHGVGRRQRAVLAAGHGHLVGARWRAPGTRRRRRAARGHWRATRTAAPRRSTARSRRARAGRPRAPRRGARAGDG